MSTWTNDRANSRSAGDLKRHDVHDDVTVLFRKSTGTSNNTMNSRKWRRIFDHQCHTKKNYIRYYFAIKKWRINCVRHRHTVQQVTFSSQLVLRITSTWFSMLKNSDLCNFPLFLLVFVPKTWRPNMCFHFLPQGLLVLLMVLFDSVPALVRVMAWYIFGTKRIIRTIDDFAHWRPYVSPANRSKWS